MGLAKGDRLPPSQASRPHQLAADNSETQLYRVSLMRGSSSGSYWSSRCCLIAAVIEGACVFRLTSFLLLNGKLVPAALHAVPQSHPELSLLLHGHTLPSLLDVGQRRVGDGVGRSSAAADGRRRRASRAY